MATKKQKSVSRNSRTVTPRQQMLDRLSAYLLRNRFIFILSAAYLFLCINLAYTWYGQQIDADALSYFTVAEKYARGDIAHAINGYWGPVLSWLLMPAVWLGIGLSAFGKVVLSVAGLGVIVLVYRFLQKQQVDERINMIMTAGFAAIALNWAILGNITPDLIMAFFVALFAIRLVDFMERPSAAQGIVLGGIGALMYYTKAFGFFLFITVVAGVALWQWRSERQQIKKVLEQYAPMAITFVLLVSPFVIALSYKYHQFTINTTGSYNKKVYVSGPDRHAEQPLERMGPVAPPNDTAASPWEDPTYLTLKRVGWNPLHSSETLSYYIYYIFIDNIKNIIAQLWDMGAFVTMGILAMITYCFQRQRFQRGFVVFTFIAMITYISYALVFVTGRYLWGTAVLGVIALGISFDMLYKHKVINSLQLLVVGVLICGSMFFVNIQAIDLYKNPGATDYKVAMSLKNIIPKDSKIVSDNFPHSYFPCYHLKLHCYNLLAPPKSKDQPQYYDKLKRLGIEYYVDYHLTEKDVDTVEFIRKYYTPINHQTINNLVVSTYKLK